MYKFENSEVFIVTGASSGIGRSVALSLNESGATVIGIGRNQDRLDAVKNECPVPNRFNPISKDLTSNIEELPAFVSSLADKFGKLKGMALCAGITSVRPLQMDSLKTIKDVFDINYLVPVFMTKGFLNRRVNSGKGSAIVAIASTAGVYPTAGMTAYCGSKGALIASMKAVSKEALRHGIRINTISPAAVDTPMLPEVTRMNADIYPLGFGKPEDISSLVTYLLSHDARWITGQNYILDGGIF